MANTSQARKRARQAEKHRILNSSRRSSARTAIKKVLKSISSGDRAVAAEEYRRTVSLLDRVAGDGLFHRNKIARHKRRLNQKIKAMEG